MHNYNKPNTSTPSTKIAVTAGSRHSLLHPTNRPEESTVGNCMHRHSDAPGRVTSTPISYRILSASKVALARSALRQACLTIVQCFNLNLEKFCIRCCHFTRLCVLKQPDDVLFKNPALVAVCCII